MFLDALRTKFSGPECQEIEARVAKTRKDGMARRKNKGGDDFPGEVRRMRRSAPKVVSELTLLLHRAT